MDTNIIHKFESKMCTLCGLIGVNQYFQINSNFIEYNGIYHSLHEILNEALSINVCTILILMIFKLIRTK